MKTAPFRIVDLITTATDKKFEAVGRMADAIVAVTLNQGDCLPQDLYTNGFTHQDVIAFWHFANAVASVELKCMKDHYEELHMMEVRYA